MPRTFLNGTTAPLNDADIATKLYVDRWCPVGSRAATYEGTDGAAATSAVTTYARTGRTLHKVIGAAPTVRLEYQNWYTSPASPGEISNASNVSVRATLEYPAGSWRQVSGSTTWSATTAYNPLDQVIYSGTAYVALKTTTVGTTPAAALGTEWQQVVRYPVSFTGQDSNRAAVMAAGGSLASLPLTVGVVEGQYMAVTTTMSSGLSTGTLALEYQGIATGEFAIDYPSSAPAPGVDLVDKNVTTETTAAAGTRAPMPSAILGLPGGRGATRWVGIVGDSLVMGYLDAISDFHTKGYLVRAAEYEDVRYRRIMQGGDRIEYWNAANAPRRLALLAGAETVICDLGSNDLANSRTFAQMQTFALATWTELGRRGAKVYQTTITPKTTSTDGWATLANQTAVFTAGSAWDQFNGWLRGGASTVINGVTVLAGQAGHPLTGVIDVATAVSDASDYTKWKSPGWTTDGGHPTPQGYDALAKVVRYWMGTAQLGTANRHALRHAVGGDDPITPAAIGAADAATLGGFLPALTSSGGLTDYLMNGIVAESFPAWAPVGNLALASDSTTMLVMAGYATNQPMVSVQFVVKTAMSGGVARLNVYTGTGPAALTRVNATDAVATTQLQSTGLQTVALTGTLNGYIAVVLTLTTAPSAYPQLASAVPVDTALLRNASGTYLVGKSSSTAVPGATLAANAGFATMSARPWMAVKAF